MIWLYRWIVDLFNAIAEWYYRRKYGGAARRLGRLPHEGEPWRRGFIALEIDGLAYDYLRQAQRQGAMPYLTRLLLGRKLRVARWHCGVPATTPASQAGILFGNNWDIPGFRWYDKATGDSVMCKLPGAVHAIQERIAAGRAGLLRGGSSYTNLFDGDARLALFTLSAVGRDHLFENVRGLGFLALFVLSPLSIARVIGLSFWTWMVYVGKRFASWIRARPRQFHFTFLGPLLEIFNNIIFREITTFCVMVDVYRGMPAIYAGYTGYDEIAHHFGANSKEAFQALRGIDKQIRKIDRIRQIYRPDDCDLYVLSDHGMTPSVPFRWAYGQTLQEFLAEQTGKQVETGEGQGQSEGLPEVRARFLLDEIRGLEARPRHRLSAQLLRAARHRLEQRLPAEALAAEWDLGRRGDIEVRNSGSLSHVYLNVTPRQMDLSEVALLYPSLLEALIAHEGIGLVVGRDGDEVVIAGTAGTLWLGAESERVEGHNPLHGMPDADWARKQIARLAHFPHAGDLILFGAWDGECVISFEDQVATHGGLGGPQDSPFLAYPPEEGLAARRIDSAEEVYTRFIDIYGSESGGGAIAMP